jgi:hypothetical protein
MNSHQSLNKEGTTGQEKIKEKNNEVKRRD